MDVPRQRSHPFLTRNSCLGNKESGFSFFSRASRGTLRSNVAGENGKQGFYITGHAQPLLEANTARGNLDSGIFYHEHAAATP